MDFGSRPNGARAMQDIAGGLALVAIGLVALWLVQRLPATGPMGFGSGTAPRLCAWAVIALGGLIAVIGWFSEGPGIAPFGWRGLLTILGAVVLFALALPKLGLIATGIPVMLLAASAAPDFRWKEGLVFAAVLTVLSAALFRYGLAQAIPIWPKL